MYPRMWAAGGVAYGELITVLIRTALAGAPACADRRAVTLTSPLIRRSVDRLVTRRHRHPVDTDRPLLSVPPMIFDISCQGPVPVPSGMVKATRTGRSTAR